MARKRKQSGADDLMDLVALLPWWAGVALALVMYLVLHQMAVPPKPTALQPGQMADFVGRSMLSAFALFGQYVIPFICLFSALASFLRRRKREGLIEKVTESRGADALNAMSWRDFEILVGEAFRLQGYQVTEQGGAGADGGIDLTLRKGTETFLVQCKQWKALKVGVDVVRELYGVMAAQGAAGGFVVTSGTFTADALAFAQGRNVKLVDGSKLSGLIQQARVSKRGSSAGAAIARPAEREPAAPAATATPLCPVCAATMVRRTAKKGVNVGSQFWGCSRYPACRGTR